MRDANVSGERVAKHSCALNGEGVVVGHHPTENGDVRAIFQSYVYTCFGDDFTEVCTALRLLFILTLYLLLWRKNIGTAFDGIGATLRDFIQFGRG